METDGCDTTFDEIFNFKCTTCAKRNRNREAVNYCVECQGYCCQACVEVHQDFPTLFNHNLLDKSSFNSAFLDTELPAVPTERCSVHGTKIVDMYCQDHDKVGCATCMALNHRYDAFMYEGCGDGEWLIKSLCSTGTCSYRQVSARSCKDLQSIPDVIDRIFQRSDVEKSLQTLTNKQASIRTAKVARDKLLQELQKSKTEAIHAIKDFRKETEQLLNNLEKESIIKVESTVEEMESALIHERQAAEKEEDALQSTRKDLQKAEGNRAQEFVCMKIAQTKSDSAEVLVRSLQTRTDAKMLFSANQEIISFLEQLKSFGAVTSHRFARVSLKRNLYTVKNTKEINIRMQTDAETCWVTGLCLTQDGMLLLTERMNKNLKRADMVKTTVVDKCNLPDNPWDVCCVSLQAAVVTLCKNTIQFVSLGKEMKTIRQIKLNHKCFGIAYKDDILYITDNKKSLYIHDMTGKVLQTVTKDCCGNDLFLCSRHVALSDNGEKIFVANGRNGVVVLDAHGTYVDTFTDRSVTNAFGVCTDNGCNIFVCGSHNVVQISEDGKEKYGEVIKQSNGIYDPYSVTFNPCDGTLVVSQWNSDKIRMFELV